ncbi:MAG: hypothetical protein PVG79_07205 [Gemmatimonadales bacterium]|jgi:hypothetical protein
MPQLGKISVSQEFRDLVSKAIEHALSAVREAEALVPFVMTLEDGEDRFYRLAGEDMSAVQDMLQNIVSGGGKGAAVDAYAFAWDVLVSTKEGETDQDAILVEGAERGAAEGVLVMQPYRKAGAGAEFGPQGAIEVVGHPRPRFQGARTDPATMKARFTDEEWERLKLAPYLVFFTVAAADGDLDSDEIDMLAKILSNAPAFSDDLLRALLMSTRDDALAMVQSLAAERKDVKAELPAVAAIVDKKMSAAEAESFKKSLFFVGAQVASASGQGIFGPDSKVSEGEAEAIALIAMLLDVEM